MARNKGTNLPSDPAVNLNDNEDVTVRLVLAEANGVVRSDGDIGAVDERGPNVELFVALIRRRDGGSEGDLLAPVGHIGVETVVVDADFVVGIARGKCDLEVGSEEVRDCGVEGINGDVSEDEGWF